MRTVIADPSTPIQPALDAAQPGDVIEVQAGVYTEPLVLRTSGTEEQPITLQAHEGVAFRTPNAPNVTTNGQSSWRLLGWASSDSQSAVEVQGGSTHLVLHGLRATANRFAVRITDGSFITVCHAYADACKNAFRVVAGHDLLFEECEAYRSQDIYEGMSETYRNGDGFILEAAVHQVALRRIKTAEHWDAGIDCKASDVRIEDVLAWGCKNNFKMWGRRILMRNCLSHGAIRQPRPDGTTVEGQGLTCEEGAEITAERCTVVDNQHYDVRQYKDSQLTLRKCVIARDLPDGGLYDSREGVPLVSLNCVWHNVRVPNEAERIIASQPTSVAANPDFVDRVSYVSRRLPVVGCAGITPPIDALSGRSGPTPPTPPGPIPPPPTPAPPTPPSPVPSDAFVTTLPRTGKSTKTWTYANKDKTVSVTVPKTAVPTSPLTIRLTIEAAS